MLKLYHERGREKTSEVDMVSATAPVVVVTKVEESEEDSVESVSIPTGQLCKTQKIIAGFGFVLKLCQSPNVQMFRP